MYGGMEKNQKPGKGDIVMKGNVIVNKIEVGDTHYEYFYGARVEMKVIEPPVRTLDREGDGYWTWKSEIIPSGVIQEYGVNEKYTHYSSNLYDYEAYTHKDNKTSIWDGFNEGNESE